jgi:hypothetical protein
MSAAGAASAAAASPSPILARQALRAGWRDLWRWPAVTLLALFAALVGALAMRAAGVRALELWRLAFADLAGSGEHFFGLAARASGVWLSGSAVAALLVDATRAAALVAYSGAPPPDRRLSRMMRPLRLGLGRTPYMISVRATELLIYFALTLGNLFVLARGFAGVTAAPARRALVGALCLFPSVSLGLVVFCAARVAQVLIARGLLPGPAIAAGFDLLLRRFASLCRLALAGGLASLPIVIVALLCPFGLRAALFGLAALWLYAALSTVVGRDGRLLTG